MNPDRELRRIAAERGWRVLVFGERLVPRAGRAVPLALYGVPFVLGVWAAGRRAA